LTLHDYKLVCPVYTLLRAGRPCEACLGRMPWPLLAHRCKNSSLAESAVLFAEAFVHRLGKSYARGVARFSAPSHFLKDKLVQGGFDPARIAFLPNALPLTPEQIAAAYVPPPARETPELIWIGRMSAEKGLPTLLAALAACRRPLRLLLVGDGPEEAAIRALAADLGLGERLRFLGRQPRSAIPRLLAEADGSVLPSEWYENAPLSLLESLALGRPVIASAMGGVPEILRDGQTGWLYPAGDREALRGVLEAWSASPQERRRRGEAAYEDARARYSPRLILDQTVELYESLTVKVQ
jgi:glycosyltransferase involved in cell wall biosynthesis